MDSIQQLEQHRHDLLSSAKPDRQHEKGKLTADERTTSSRTGDGVWKSPAPGMASLPAAAR